MLTKKITKKWNLHLYAHNHFLFTFFQVFLQKIKFSFFIFQFFCEESEKKINKSYIIFIYRFIIINILLYYIMYYASTFLIQK